MEQTRLIEHGADNCNLCRLRVMAADISDRADAAARAAKYHVSLATREAAVKSRIEMVRHAAEITAKRAEAEIAAKRPTADSMRAA